MNVPKLRFPEFTKEWEKKKFGEVANPKSSKYNPSKETESYKCIELEHIKSGDGQLLGFVDSKGLGSIKNKFDKGDVLFGKLRPYLKKYLQASFNGVCSSEIWVLRGLNISNDFLYRIVQTDYFIELANKSTGSKMPRADWNIVSSGIFSFPSLLEQEKIATFLTSVDEKLTQLKKKKTLLAQYKKGVMQKIFSQELRFKNENGKYLPEWIRKTLGEVTERIGDGLHGTPSYTENTGFYFINGNNLINGSIVINETTKEVDLETYNQNRKGLNENTLLISINGTIGNVARYQNEKIMLGKSAGYFNFKENTNFYYYLLNADHVQNYFISELTGSTIKNLSLKTLREAEFLLPSLPEQTKIANFLSAIDEKINYCSTQIEKTELWKKGLLQKMFV